MTTTTLLMGQLVALAKGAATKALHESREVTCGVSMPEKDRPDFIYRQILTAVFDAIGYKLPVDPEREAFDKWITTAGWDMRDSTFEAWKAGREELRKALNKPHYIFHKEKVQEALNEIIPQIVERPETFETHGSTWTKHTPGDPPPCDAATLIDVLMQDRETGDYIECLNQQVKHTSTWGAIIGWRYAAKQPENDGWIEWGGGKCPVDSNVKVAVRYRFLVESDVSQAENFHWNHIGHQYDIIAYKIIPQTTTK